MPTTNDIWGQFTADGGRWAYGYGQYEKQLNDLAKPPDLYASDTGGLWPTLDALVAALNASSTAVADAAMAQTTFTSYYIYAIDPNGQKRMCGEWTLGQGGRAARDAYFNQTFEPNFITAPNQDKIETVIAAAQIAPPPFNLDTFKAQAANAVPGPSVTPDGGPPSNTSKMIVFGLAALIVYLVLRK